MCQAPSSEKGFFIFTKFETMKELINLINKVVIEEKKRRQEELEKKLEISKTLVEHCTPFFQMISIINTPGDIVFGRYEQPLSCYLIEDPNRNRSLDEVRAFLLENGYVCFYVGPDCDKHKPEEKMMRITFTINTNKSINLTLEYKGLPKTFYHIDQFNECFLKTIMPYAIFK